MTLTTEIKFRNCHATTCRGLCLTLWLRSSNPYIYSAGKFDSCVILVRSLSFSWLSEGKLNRQIFPQWETCLRLWVSGLDKRRTGRGKVPDPTATFSLISINQEHEENQGQHQPCPLPTIKNKWRILGNSALFLFLSSSLNACWAHRQPRLAQLAFITMQIWLLL